MEMRHIIQDFTRRYDQSFLFVVFPESKEENLFHVESIEPDNEERLAVITLKSPDYGTIKLNYGTNHTFKFRRPTVGVFQYGTDAYIYRRRPEKQYKHGLCPSNSQLLPVHRWTTTVGRNDTNNAPFEFEMVQAAFEQKAYYFDDAVKMLQSGKYRSVAMRRGYSLMLSPSSLDSYVLMYYTTPIAWVDLKGSISKIIENIYKPQIEHGEYR